MFCYISLQIKFDSLEYFDYRYSVKLQLNKTQSGGKLFNGVLVDFGIRN